MQYVKTVAYLNGVNQRDRYGDYREYFKSLNKDFDCKLEFDWSLFESRNPGIVQWLNKRPEHKLTKSSIFSATRFRIPEELKTKDDIVKYINEHVEDIVRKDKVIKEMKQSGRVFSVDISDIEYGSCNYKVPVSYSFDIEVPLDVIEEGEDAIRQYIEENYLEHSDADYGDYEYNDYESSDYNGSTIDSITPDPQDVIDEITEENEEEEEEL